MPSTGNDMAAPRVHAELRAEGQTVSRKRVERVMRQHGIRARAPRRYRVCTTDSKHSLPVAANLLDQNFVAEQPNQVWLADITYIPTERGLALPGRDPRPVHPQGGRLGHARSHARRTHHRCAHHGDPTARPGAGLIHHSDRGSQYAISPARSGGLTGVSAASFNRLASLVGYLASTPV